MRIFRFLPILIILILFNLSYVFSAANPVCCYDGNSINSKQLCSIGEILIPSLDAKQNCEPNIYNSKQLGCIDSSNQCSETANNLKIFDFPQLKLNNLQKISKYCSNGLVNFQKDSRCKVLGNSNSNLGNSGISSGGTGVGNQISNPKIDKSSINNLPFTKKQISGCSNVAGGSFGFFVTKNSCESSIDISQNSCLYNPNLGGLLSGYLGFNDVKIWSNSNSLEDACISKSLIRTCDNYKTKNNCDNNRAKISDSCSWIPNSNFENENILLKKSGICISNSVSPNKYFNKKSFSKRGNLIKNPSFENLENWDILTKSKLVYSQNSFERNYYHLLEINGISQRIYNLGEEKQYLISLYAKYNSSLKNSGIILQINAYDSNKSLIKSFTETKKFSDLKNPNENIFTKLNFNSIRIPYKTYFIEFKLSSKDNNLIGIDAVNFIEEDVTDLTINSQIFNPLEIIPKEASNCNLCFENNNFNTCTKQKSNLLGDCEYLVTGPEKSYDTSSFTNPNFYLGNSNNNFMFKGSEKKADKNLKWQSQSLPKSEVFCELYVNKNSCENSNNYINSNFKQFHPNSGNSLCKWNSAFGCFKDSNNDGLTDTFTDTFKFNFPYISRFNKLNFKTYEKNPLIPNVFDKLSFEKGCDILPPNSYIYFTGKNINGTKITIKNDVNEIVGDLKLHLNLEDLSLDSCSNFNFEKKLILDVGINSNFFAKEFLTSQFKDILSMDSLFSNVLKYVNLQGTEISINDYKEQFFNKLGKNIFTFIVFDQSGNIGKKFKFNFKNLDLNPPKISLANYNYTFENWISDSSFGKNTVLNFKIKDLTNSVCNYKLNPINGFLIDKSFYLSSGKINFSNNSGNNFNFNLSNYIFKSSENFDVYNLTLICSDIFGQKSKKEFDFTVDFDTRITLVSPSLFIENILSNTGYINGNTKFIAASTESSLSSCILKNFSDYNINTALNIKTSPGFNLKSHPGINYYNNITGDLNFKTEGKKTGQIKCTDNIGNIFSKKLVYVFDKTPPFLKNFSIKNKKNNDNSNNIFFNGTDSFLIGYNSKIILNLNFNGTGSFVNNIHNLSGWNETGIWNHLKNLGFDKISTKIIDDGISNIKITNFDSILKYQGIKQIERDLFLKKFSFNFTDSAKNTNSDFVNYYYDSSIPQLIFLGDVISQDDITGEIYTSKANPRINLSFNSPSYRKYSCRIIGKDKVGFSQFEFSNLSNYFSFNLNKIFNYDVDVEKDNISLDISCTDVYNKKLSNNYKLIFDNIAPILNDISFENGHNKIFKTRSLNKLFPQIEDKLKFDLVNTNEVSYKCYYNFKTIDDSFYSCNQSSILENFYSSGIVSSKNLVILDGTNHNNKSICVRNNKFKNNLKINSIDVNKSLSTKIILSGYCQDKVGLKTKTINKDLNIIYTPNDFVSFNFKYKDKKAYATVRSFVNYDSISISSDRIGNIIYDTLINPVLIFGVENPVFEYKSKNGFSLKNFKDGNKVMYALSPNSTSSISTNLLIDNINPTSSIFIPDENDGIVYTNNFWIQLNGEDFSGSLSKIDFLLDGKNIFSYDGINVFPNSSNKNIGLDLSKGISFVNSNTLFSQFIEIKNLSFNSEHTLTLNVYDGVNNLNSTSKFIQIKDGIGLILSNSINSKVDPSNRLWVTKNIAPIIKFNTTKPVKFCQVDSQNNKEWKKLGVKKSSKITLSNPNNYQSEFNLDLSTINGFDLSKLGSKINSINISCQDLSNSSLSYNFNRDLRYVNYLPDYVLTSSNGFVLNENPYTTNIKIKSVGAYRFINCKYDDGKNGFVNFNQKDSTIFQSKLDYSNAIFNSGINNLKIQCTDILGNIGPIKTYPFSIDKNSNLKISQIFVVNSNHFKSFPVISGSNDGIIYVDKKKDLSLKLKLNKKNNVECFYNTNSGIFAGFILKIENLFGIGSQKLSINENPFVYTLDKFNLNSNSEILNIKCSVLGTNEVVNKIYDIKFLDNVNNVSNFILG